MKYNPKPYERLLSRYILGQAAGLEQLINEYIRQAVLQVTRVSPTSDKDFEFRDYPALSRAVDDTLRLMSNRITSTILAGSMWAWDLANLKNDDMVANIVRVIGANRIPTDAISHWSQKNLPALEAFQGRKIGGMNLSDKVWAYSRGIKGDLELALDLGIGEGKSADSLSRSVRQFLREPDRLYRRVRDEKGVLHLSKSASNYHPGQGVYRSSYKNAQRLAATETNMAYRTADHDRMQQMDFVLGIEIHLSNNHTRLNAKGEPEPFFDICDELQGRYPKDFIFKGWHPNCRCYVTSILPDKNEFMEYLAGMDENGNSSYQFKNEVTEMPEQILKWMEENEYRVIRAKALPYWIRDNEELLSGTKVSASNEAVEIISKRTLTDEERAVILARAEERHNARTKADIRDIQDRWDERIYGKAYVDNVHAIEQALGVQRGKRMTHEEANFGRVNPFYLKRGHSNNCSTCSGVYVLRRIGFDVSAKGNIQGTLVYALSRGETSWDKWIDGKTKYHKTYDWSKGAEMSTGSYMAFIRRYTKQPGIYEFNVGWEKGGGHSTLLERKANGDLIRIEQQRMGISESVSDLVKRLEKYPPTTTRGIMRVDNAKFNPKYWSIVRVNRTKR